MRDSFFWFLPLYILLAAWVCLWPYKYSDTYAVASFLFRVAVSIILGGVAYILWLAWPQLMKGF